MSSSNLSLKYYGISSDGMTIYQKNNLSDPWDNTKNVSSSLPLLSITRDWNGMYLAVKGGSNTDPSFGSLLWRPNLSSGDWTAIAPTSATQAINFIYADNVNRTLYSIQAATADVQFLVDQNGNKTAFSPNSINWHVLRTTPGSATSLTVGPSVSSGASGPDGAPFSVLYGTATSVNGDVWWKPQQTADTTPWTEIMGTCCFHSLATDLKTNAGYLGLDSKGSISTISNLPTSGSAPPWVSLPATNPVSPALTQITVMNSGCVVDTNCPSGQTCVTGACQAGGATGTTGATGATGTCSEKCGIFRSCDEKDGKCKIAVWVWIVIGILIILLIAGLIYALWPKPKPTVPRNK